MTLIWENCLFGDLYISTSCLIKYLLPGAGEPNLFCEGIVTVFELDETCSLYLKLLTSALVAESSHR